MPKPKCESSDLKTTPSCADCKYFDTDNSECRRYPSIGKNLVTGDSTYFEGQWPYVASNDWCGEFQPKEKDEQKN